MELENMKKYHLNTTRTTSHSRLKFCADKHTVKGLIKERSQNFTPIKNNDILFE